MRKISALFAVILAVSGVATAMTAVNVSATDLTRWEGNVTGNTSHTTVGGNITSLTLGEQRLTDRWAGYYGTVSAEILLTDNASAPLTFLYKWAANASNLSGEFCASTNPSFAFATAATPSAGDIDLVWAFAGGLDLATNTFTNGTCDLTFTQDSHNVTGIQAKGDSGTSTFASCAIAQAGASTKDEFAFCTDAMEAGTSYNSQAVNFEFMVAVNETGTETYYFFMELDA